MRYGVILAGGGGTRLWPASRRARAKQFLPLGPGGESLLGATWRRLAAALPGDHVAVVTGASQAGRVADELPQLAPANLFTEPVGRNTAAAIGLAAVLLGRRDPDAILAILPADHHIGDEAGFASVLDAAFAAVEGGASIVTVGVVPTRPETGYGYLRVGADIGGGLRRVEAFVEKPDARAALAYLGSGDYLWNGGMFFARADRLAGEIRRHLPETGAALDRVADALRAGEDWTDVAAEIYPALPSISIDEGVMEKTAAEIAVIPGDFGWSDVGSWTALADLQPADAGGNVVSGEAALVDARGNITFAEPGIVIGLLGVEGLVVVASGDAVLVAPRERAQEVRALVAAIADAGGEDHL